MTVAQLTHAPIVVSASSVALVTAGLIWPLGCIFLARTVFGPSRTVTYAAAFGSVAFSAFPFWLMGYGVLWANLLGQALLPLWVRLPRDGSPAGGDPLSVHAPRRGRGGSATTAAPTLCCRVARRCCSCSASFRGSRSRTRTRCSPSP